jgi:hypothetical protein
LMAAFRWHCGGGSWFGGGRHPLKFAL